MKLEACSAWWPLAPRAAPPAQRLHPDRVPDLVAASHVALPLRTLGG